MIQLDTNSVFGPQDSSASLLPALPAQSGDSFQAALSAALSTTLQNFGIDPNKVTLSLTPVTSAVSAASPFSATANISHVTRATPTADDTANSVPSFDDAYWAAQPTAVQALRNVEDYDQRTQLAAQLSAQGYSIDVPIMVYGWDPAKITAARESYGYTWVPSAMQKPIAEAPGISTPGAKPYDPNNPPSGSIAV
jgi:hypothetical protein